MGTTVRCSLLFFSFLREKNIIFRHRGYAKQNDRLILIHLKGVINTRQLIKIRQDRFYTQPSIFC